MEGDVLKCARLDIQHGELEIPPGALLSHSNHLNHSRSEPANKPRVPGFFRYPAYDFGRPESLLPGVGFRKYVRWQLALRNNRSIALPASCVV